jgi:mRNA-degrading endonuclease RelE of RelBE toxin-antitoxin system
MDRDQVVAVASSFVTHQIGTGLKLRVLSGPRCRTTLNWSRRAQRDLRALPDRDRSRIVRALREGLAADPLPRTLEVVALQGRAPWLRLRSGDWRVLRPLSTAELVDVAGAATRGFLVARIVNRRDLERAVATLPRID